ncbi:MAG: Zn-ribbon domain-containing OB-fold protein [Proteobacteria bacterium]|nr:Zn-ribbon domain-containing OB-fold protein [Pseudomonadota bacterium]MBU1451693.1 Zn-ribbon domain-containing OB-fold protein [Pseudomonadota bacterium]MBU2467611.1 Zn-ribbon domain-containing OB-fold protein [Pseudomonadota bacterium]MBU2518780.1 Zn-ribbon domain-containing OB-fold protein [Pseudomonadota bacterium]
MSANKKPEADRRFAKFGTVSFTATTKVNDFIGYLEDGKVAGTKCLTCGAVFFPPRAQCHKCREKAQIEWFQIEGVGKLATYSELKYAPTGFTEDLPYAIAVLDMGGYKLFGRIGDVPLDQVKVGMELAPVPNELPNGQLNYVFNRP